MVLDRVRRIPVRHLEQQFVRVLEVDRREHAVRRLHNWQTLETLDQRTTALAAGKVDAARRWRRRRTRSSGRTLDAQAVIGFGLPTRNAIALVVGRDLRELFLRVVTHGDVGHAGL